MRLKDRWVAYPFQNNVAALAVDDQVACLKGLVAATVRHATSAKPPANFDEWILRTQVRAAGSASRFAVLMTLHFLCAHKGEGIADLFMRPYNFKVWAVPTTMMQCEWLGERVAAPDVGRAISNVLRNKEDAGWGPNAVFRFPTQCARVAYSRNMRSPDLFSLATAEGMARAAFGREWRHCCRPRANTLGRPCALRRWTRTPSA